MPSQAYFEIDGVGDWYACIQATSAGESPATAPDKWVKLEIPAIFESYVVEKVTALLLVQEGQSDKRRAQEQAAAIELEELEFRHTERGDYARPEVMTR
jgi:hypothetical protein